jgi:hypothetical protein
VWNRESGGLVLTFHLAGINNQNFLMRDEQTGSYWQQISGAAVSGPLAGRRLTFVPSDELSYGLWVGEEPHGTVLQDVVKYVRDYAAKDWDLHMTEPTVLSFANPALGLEARTLMLGVHAFGASRAFSYAEVIQEKLVLDHVGPEPVLLVVGADGKSVRIFHDRIPGVRGVPSFYRTLEDTPSHRTDAAWLKQAAAAPLMMDEATGSAWDFHGCALVGKEKGICLEQIETIKDFWFDWRNYNPTTTVYAHKP